MLLMCRNNRISCFVTWLIFILTNCIFVSFVYGEESPAQPLKVHGFIAQGIIDVNGSSFVNNDGAISTQLTELGINASYRLTDNVRLTGQAVYLNGGNRFVTGARIDYALIDFSVFHDDQWLINLYLGRFKNNNWLYSSTRDVPHARPSIILPQSVYFDGFRDIAMGSDGAALKVNYSSDQYGNFDLYLNYGATSLNEKDVKLLLGDSVRGAGKQNFDAQAGFYWQPDFSPWQFGISLLDSDFEYNQSDDDFFVDSLFSFQQYTGNILYEGERWQFSSEFFRQKFTQKGFYFDQFKYNRIGEGFFVQSKYVYNSELSFMARYERFYADKNDKNGSTLHKLSQGTVPKYFGYQNDVTIGASYDFADSYRIQFEHHWVKGTARLTPIVMPNLEVNNQKYWDMWAIQLMYWF